MGLIGVALHIHVDTGVDSLTGGLTEVGAIAMGDHLLDRAQSLTIMPS